MARNNSQNGEPKCSVYDRKLFEVCVFSHLAQELKSGDIAIIGSEEYGDYRDGLLDWQECEPLIDQYCMEMGLPANASEFAARLKTELSAVAEEIDQSYPKNSALSIDEQGELILKKIEKAESSPTAKKLEDALVERMPERNLLDILSNVQFHTGWTRHFGPLSGSDPKIERPIERYLLTLFTYGCNLGPAPGRPSYARNCFGANACIRQSAAHQRQKTRCGTELICSTTIIAFDCRSFGATARTPQPTGRNMICRNRI